MNGVLTPIALSSLGRPQTASIGASRLPPPSPASLLINAKPPSIQPLHYLWPQRRPPSDLGITAMLKVPAMKSSPRRRQRPTLGLKATLVSAMLLTVTATATIVYLPWSVISKRNIEAIVDQTNKEIAVGTSKEVERLFNTAESAKQLLVSSLNRDLLDLTDPEEREFFMLSVLASAPAFTWVQYGDVNGDFLGAQRTEDDELLFHFRDWDPSDESTTAAVNSYVMEQGQFVPVAQERYEMDPPYYAPARPWYEGATAAPGQRAWTVYVYRSSGTPGLDATQAIVSATGEVSGVIGVGIELAQLSEYLEELQGDRPGETFIINSQQELIASTDRDELMPDQSGSDGPQLTQFAEVQNSLLKIASDTLQQQEFSLTNLEAWQRYLHTDTATGEKYHIFLTPVGQLDWTVGTVIPESAYTAEVNRNKQRLFFGVLLFTGGIALVAVLLSDRLVARPILGIAGAAKDMEANCFKPEQLNEVSNRTDEIGQLARMFQKMAIEVYQREQRLRHQVMELRVEIDEAKRKQQVKDIVDTDFFRDLTLKAKALRDRDS